MTDDADQPHDTSEPADTPVIDGALRSRPDEAPWSVAWGKLPAGVRHVRVTFNNGRQAQPAARFDLVGRYWAAEVAGRFGKVTVSGENLRATAKVRTREQPSRRGRKKAAATDPLEEMKQHWGLAALILQPGSDERPELPDIRSASGD